MAMVAVTGFASKMVTVDSSAAMNLADMGFTQQEIQSSDSIHISHIDISESAPTLYYWYSASVAEGGSPVSMIPLNEADGPEGHPIYPGGERIMRGIRNARNFHIIAGESTTQIAITIGTFGRTPIS